MKKTKRSLLLTLLLICLGIGLASYYFYLNPFQSSKTAESSSSSKSDYTTFNGEIRNYIKLSNGMLLADGTTSLASGVSKQYLTAVSGKILNKTYHTGQYHKGDTVQLTIYNTDDTFKQKKARTLDLKKALADYSKNYLYAGSYVNIYQDEASGDYFLKIKVIDKDKPLKEYANYTSLSPSTLEKHSHPIYFNLRTETFKKHITLSEPPKGLSNLGNIYSTEVTNLYELTDRGSTIFVSDSFANFHSHLKQFQIYTQYSLDKYDIKSSGTYILYWYGEPNSKELAELLAPEGQTDIFQGVTLYGKYSKDGQDHVVQSYDELMSWYQEPAETETPASSSNAE